MVEQNEDGPRIYVADLAAYNRGELRGEWIELDSETTIDDLRAAIHAMLEASSKATGEMAEEFAIHDYEGFHGCSIHEYDDLERVAALAQFVSVHGELGGQLLGHFADVDGARKALDESYAGEASSLSDWAWEYLKETGQLLDIPEQWHSYLDVEKWATDLELGGDIFAIDVDGSVHVFWTR